MVPNEGKAGGVFLGGEPKGGKRSDEAIWRCLIHRFEFSRGWLSCSRKRRGMMPEEQPPSPINRELTAKIVAAYVRRNQIGSDQLGTLISTVHQALVGRGKAATEAEVERTPAVPISRSVHRDYVVC